MAGGPTELELGTRKPASTQELMRGSTRTALLPQSLAAGLHEVGRASGTTLFMTLLAGFQLLLSRYTGQTDITVGTTVAGRQAETESMIGFCVNLVPLRTDLSGEPRFADLLQRVREVCLGAFQHQDLPFGMLVRELRPDRELTRTPLFQTTFMLQNQPQADSLELAGLRTRRLTEGGGLDARMRALEAEAIPAVDDLSLYVFETGADLLAVLHYREALFDARTVDRMLEHYRMLLEAIVAAPQTPVDALNLLGADERRRLVVEHNRVPAAAEPACVHELVSAQAHRTPDAIAVETDDGEIGYGELERRANRLARQLQACGVRPDDRVAICLDRCADLAVGLLGILKAGAAYLPLDPCLPEGRLAFMLEDSAVGVVLTRLRFAERFESRVTRVVRLDDPGDAGEIESRSDEPPQAEAGPEHGAYVIYTSGSTGEPKGVVVPHRAVVNHNLAVAEQFGLGPDDRVLQFHSISFDGAVEELFPTWMRGGTVVLRAEGMMAPGAAWHRFIESAGLTVLNLPTAYWHEWVQELGRTGARLPERLRLVIVGGEEPSVERLRVWRGQGGATKRWLNTYGPTEGTVIATAYEALADEPPGTRMPIGRPIAGASVYVLDSGMQPVPEGVPGELFIGGAGVARGYLGRPGATAERFVPDPFGAESGARLYRTGDRARWRTDGRLEFLGRVDDQVKIRGFRIEPGEIEARLMSHEAVGEAVALVREDVPGDRRLVAYVVAAAAGTTVDVAALQAHLRERLPDYMVPADFVELAELPMTPTGKLDRRRLPEPERTRPELAEAFVAPRTPLEQELAVLWSGVLGIERIGVHDNFFELGGHSMQAVQLISRIGERLSVELPLPVLFERPTVAGLAEAAQLLMASGEAALVEVDLEAEAQLDPAIVVEGCEPARTGAPTDVLLTGANGFLGVHLLHELLARSTARVHCLVRCDDPAAGLDKVRRAAEEYGLWDESAADRVVIVPGDLARPALGLDAETHAELARRIDAIYHNGAWVNFVFPYNMLKATNVDGTVEVLRLACTERVKPVHHVSTISVFPTFGHGDDRIVGEDRSLQAGPPPGGGYTQTKWVAERLLEQARERGLPVSVYRPGRITGQTSTGLSNNDDVVPRFIKTCIQLGSLPEVDTDVIVDMVPVDFVSRAIVHLSSRDGAAGTYHVVNPRPISWRELLEWMRTYGYAIESRPFEAWREELHGFADRNGGDFVARLMSHVSDRVATMGERLAQMARSDAEPLRFDCANTMNGLEGSGIECAPVDDALLATYFEFFIRSGFLAPPGRHDDGGAAGPEA
jgi:amino acid adenylation domain-containing protein/thioester reductase-like protein